MTLPPAPVAIAPLGPGDRNEWEALARGYKHFYNDPIPDEDYARTWALVTTGGPVHGLGARLGDSLVGFAHYLFHAHSWAGTVCYLQDLYTRPEMRGRGVARSLIGAVADAAREAGASRYYWLTMEDNGPARVLYDKVARFKGFIRYDYPL